MRYLIVVFLFLEGCGGCSEDKNGRLPDAPPRFDGPETDGPPDGPPDAQVQQDPPVTLTVTNLGEPAVGVHVYFLNADDTVVKATVTDGYGVASAVMAAGGSVTAIRPFTTALPVAPQGRLGGKVPPDELRTFVGVKPGDHLVLTRTATEFATFTLRAKAVTDATNYDVFTTCGAGSIAPGGGGSGSGNPDPGGSLSLENCHGAADIAIVASVVNVDGTTPLKGLYHGNAAIQDGVAVDLAGDTYQDLVNVTFTYMNAPDATLSVLHAPLLAHGALSPFEPQVSGGAGTISEPNLSATRAIVDTSLTKVGRHEVVDWDLFTTDYKLDLANLLLPDITAGPAFDVATGRVTWTEDASGAAPDLTSASILVRRTEPTFGKWHWEIVAPYTAGEIRFPHLPTDLFDWTPVASDQIDAEPVTNARATGGYDAVRARFFDIVDQGSLGGFVTGSSGRVVKVQSEFQPLLRAPRRR